MKIEVIGDVVAGFIAASAFLFAIVVLGRDSLRKKDED